MDNLSTTYLANNVADLTTQLERFNDLMEKNSVMVSKMMEAYEPFIKLVPKMARVTEYGLNEALEKIEEGYRLGYHKAAKMAEIATWAEMWAVTDLDPEILRSVFLRPFPTVQEAVDEALAVKGPTGVLFLMSASMTVPRVAR